MRRVRLVLLTAALVGAALAAQAMPFVPARWMIH